MRFILFGLTGLFMLLWLTSCVDPTDYVSNASIDLLVVDGTITNLSEPQLIRLNHAQADRLTGRSGTTPITKATVEVIVDSSQIVTCFETEEGTYQLPSDFRGQIGHAYQLRFTLDNGNHYVSAPQIMQPVPPIRKVSVRFNSNSLPPALALTGDFRAGHDVSIDWQDPVNQQNYYKWEWKLWEKQDWCRSCQQGIYAVNNILPRTYKDKTFYVSGDDSYEACFVPANYFDASQPPYPNGQFVYDYPCRTQCWEILYSYSINTFDDQFSNGGLIQNRNVAQIPYYDSTACLIEIRQMSLTKNAHAYFKLFQDQTQNTGGIADTPPSAPVGNIQNIANSQDRVVGYFTASAVSAIRYWIDRKDVKGFPFGDTDPTQETELPGSELFYSLNLRQPIPEPIYPYPTIRIWGGPPRPATALCVPSNSRTPVKPAGWLD